MSEGYEKFKLKKSSRLKPVRHLLQRNLFRVFAITLQCYPIKQTQNFGRTLGSLLYRFVKREKKIALFQLGFCFPELPEEERQKIAKGCFQNLAISLLEFIVLNKIRAQQDRWIQYHEPEKFLNFYRENKGCILMMSHFGNWELLAVTVEKFQVHTTAVVRGREDDALSQYFNQRRESDYLTVVERDSADIKRKILKFIKNRHAAIIAMDLDTNIDSIYVDFFGKKAKTPSTIARLALKYDFPVVMAYDLMDEKGVHHFHFNPLFDPALDKEKYPDVASLCQFLNLKLEELIRKYPDKWAWFHRRWRNSPEKI